MYEKCLSCFYKESDGSATRLNSSFSELRPCDICNGESCYLPDDSSRNKELYRMYDSIIEKVSQSH